MLKASVATIRIQGMGALSQSRQHSAPKLEGETHDDYDARTWHEKLNVGPNGTVVIPAHGFHQALAAAARYTGEQIPGQGKKTWTKKFETGLQIFGDLDTGIDPATVTPMAFSVSAQGRRGVGARVTRRFPMMTKWSASGDIYILDPIITQAVFERMLGIAGMFIGVGRFRPEVGGQNGRFKLDAIDWQDNRQLAA